MSQPTFQRRHYEAIAGMFNEHLAKYTDEVCRTNPDADEWRSAVTYTALLHTHLFAADNELFDAVRFLTACGFTEWELNAAPNMLRMLALVRTGLAVETAVVHRGHESGW